MSELKFKCWRCDPPRYHLKNEGCIVRVKEVAVADAHAAASPQPTATPRSKQETPTKSAGAFDRNAYQRELMRKRRSKAKESK